MKVRAGRQVTTALGGSLARLVLLTTLYCTLKGFSCRASAANPRKLLDIAHAALRSPRGNARRPLAISPQLQVAQRCVFILGTGRSGSTSLLDALNQIPNYLIRGEQERTFSLLFTAYQNLLSAQQHSFTLMPNSKSIALHEPHAPPYQEFEAIKQMYDDDAHKFKVSWFNDIHVDRVRDAMRSWYYHMYGYQGAGIVSGFKEIRYGCCGHPADDYAGFEVFVAFLRSLCLDTKLLLNSRRSAAEEDNAKLISMQARFETAGEHSAFLRNLNITHSWYDTYALQHPDYAMRVIMEDMSDAEAATKLKRQLLKFLGEDPALAETITFDRLPPAPRPE